MYDFALALIREHTVPAVARTTARVALVDDARTSQTPYVDATLLPQPGSEFSRRVMRQLDQNLGRPLRPRRVGGHLRCQYSDLAAAVRGRDRPEPARLPSGVACPVVPGTSLRPRTEPSPASLPRSGTGTPARSPPSSPSTSDNARANTAQRSDAAGVHDRSRLCVRPFGGGYRAASFSGGTEECHFGKSLLQGRDAAPSGLGRPPSSALCCRASRTADQTRADPRRQSMLLEGAVT